MLAAAVDYRPGEMGIQEHLWQATLGPEAVVFTTYPGNSLEHGNARPNFWAGSARLPHVTMHGRTVICLYRLDPGVGMGFTHAYFPAASFDAWRLVDNWAFAKYRDGFLGLWGDGRLELTQEGRFARQELRSNGSSRAWLCTMGSAAEDGSFETFCERLQNTPSPVVGNAPGLRWRDLGGDDLELIWQGRLHVNGETVYSSAFLPYENPYTRLEPRDRHMTLEHEGTKLVIHLGYD